MSVNIRNPLTGQLTNASGGVINPKSINEMIAPIEDGTASKDYAVGEQFIMNDLLCEVTQAIAQGDTMVIGTNCEESEQLSKQVKDINTSLTANGNRFEAGYSSANDEYGFNIGSTFYPIGASSGGGGNSGLIPNFKDKLFTFDSTHKTYTATKTCFVLSSGGGITQNIHYSINGDTFVFAHSGQDSFINPIIPLQQGDVFAMDAWDSDNYSYAVVYGASIVGGDPDITVYNGVDINFDYAHPLHTFTSGNLSYTATEDCWLMGTMAGEYDSSRTLTINNTVVYRSWNSNNTGQPVQLPPIKLSKGDVVVLSAGSNNGTLGVYRGSVVSPEVTVYNEAEVALNYANPLHRFSVGGSYTATQDCWLVGSGSNLAVSIDGTRIGDSTSANYVNIPPTKLVAGQTVSTTGSATGLNLYVLKGTVTGSVGAFKREVQRNYYFGLKYGAPVDIDISSLKDTEEITITVSYLAGNSFNSERVSVSTAKTYNSHILEAQANIGTSITYVNGKLQFVASHTTYSVMVWVTFN